MRIVAILAGHPDDPSWPTLQLQAAEALETRRPHCRVPKARRKHRRGAFVALNCGVSHGGGQTAPANLKNESPNDRILDELNGMETFRRVAGFSSGMLILPACLCYSEPHSDSRHGHLGPRTSQILLSNNRRPSFPESLPQTHLPLERFQHRHVQHGPANSLLSTLRSRQLGIRHVLCDTLRNI